jgi:surface-anchored protein
VNRLWTAAAVALCALAAAAPAAAATVADPVVHLSPRLVDDQMRLGVLHKPHGGAQEQWTAADDVVVHVNPSSETTVPSLPNYGFLGAPGDRVWTTARTEAQAAQTGGTLLGLTLEELGGTEVVFPQVTTTLHAVTGPGNAFAYQTSASGGFSAMVFDVHRTDGQPNEFRKFATASRAVHNWSFTAEGYYCLDVEMSGTLVSSGATVSDRHRIAVAVGDVDPAQAPSCRVERTPTSTSLSVAPQRTAEVGAPVELTASVLPATTPGTVQLYDGGEPLGDPQPVSSGRAQLTTGALALGRHSLTATFTPEDDFLFEGSTSSAQEYGIVQPGVVVLDGNAHADLAARLDGGAFRFQVRASPRSGTGAVTWHDFDDVVVRLADAARVEIPPDPGGAVSYRFLGEPGDPLWRIPLNAMANIVWIGLSSEGVDDADFRQFLSLRLDGVSGPGHVVLWQDKAANGAKPIFSTREGLPGAFLMPPEIGSHIHTYWDLTAPGTYCLTFGMTGRLAAAGTPVGAQETMTVVVGDEADPFATTPCGRAGTRPVGTHPEQVVRAPSGTPYVIASERRQRAGYAHIAPRIEAGELDVRLHEGSQVGPATSRDLDDVIFQVGERTTASSNLVPWVADAGDSIWRISGQADGLRATLGWDTLAIDPGELQGDLTWELERVEGPGEMTVYDLWGELHSHAAVLGDRAGHRADAHELWPGMSVDGSWAFSAPGVYCATMRWSGALAGGEPVSDRQVLTFVAGDRNPATVTPCGQGGRGDDPVSGRTVLDIGHVDVFGRVRSGTVELSIKDGRDPSEPVLRPLDEVVFHAAAGARAAVPADPRYAFLGAAGAPVWILPETPNFELLWPGWNGENDGSIAGAGSLRWTLTGVRGPGHFALFDGGGDAWGAPRVRFNTRDGLPDAFEFMEHAHGGWAFEKPGVYCLDMAMSAGAASDRGTLLVAVGAVDAARVTEADCDRSGPVDPGPQPGPGGGTPADPPAPPGGSPPPQVERTIGVTLSTGRLRLGTILRRRALDVVCRLNAAGTCKVRASLSANVARRLGLGAKSTSLGTGRVKTSRPGARTVRIALGRRSRKALQRAGKTLRIRFTATAAAPGVRGATSSVTRIARR